MPEPDYYLKRGDVGGILGIVCRDANGDAENVTGATVTFRMRPAVLGDTVIDAEASVDDGDDGLVSYTFAEGDTDTLAAGLYLAEFQVTFQDNSVTTFPNGGYVNVMVTSDVALAPVTTP